MTKERKASVIYEGNASQLVYAFPFDYLRKKFVKVEDIYTNITELTIGVDYTVEDKQVRLVKGIPLGHSVKIYRETTTAPLVEWQDASVLRSADLSLQEVQLLHLAEETADKVFDSGMSTAYDNPNCWDGQYKRIINALDPIDDGDVVTLRYIKANQDSLLNQLKNTGATQNSSIVATGDTQNARLNATGDTQNKRITDTGNAYVSTMTTLKDTATTKANDASNSAELSKKWAVSTTSPDGAADSKSSKTWAEDARKSANNSAFAATASQNSATASATSSTNASNSANASKQSANDSANSASASASSASAASTSASNAKVSETNATKSAKAAKQSEENAKTWDPTQYVKSVTELNGKVTVTKGSGDSTTFNAGLNILARNKAYAVGDIAYSPNLPSYLYLECTTAGTTGEEEPDMSTLSGGTIVDDGTARFVIKTVCAKEYVDSKSTDEAKKWKNAYNNLRKRSYPTEFDDDDELTPLISAPITSGNITLLHPYTDFDGLLIDITGVDNMWFLEKYISSAEITRRKEEAQKVGGKNFMLISSHFNVVLIIPDSSPTVFPVVNDENRGKIQQIYGVKFKEIT